ncbi:MAG: SBBP repeat-containing protein [Candidatus Moduliflexus flocculans]|nr:SBBP repeat-containing protein [Candidatus Moduliflexus flocculans]
MIETLGPGGPYVADAFIAKLDGDLTQLLTCTFSGEQTRTGSIPSALDGSGSVYVAGGTRSLDFPTTAEAFDQTFHGDSQLYSDAFVARLDSELSILLASTFLGGSDTETSASLALDTAGNVFVAGSTCSVNFPTTAGAYDTTIIRLIATSM